MENIKTTTKLGQAITKDHERKGYGAIDQAYGRPSGRKVRAYNDIWFRAKNTAGYNNDLRVISRNSNFFSTIYSYTVDGITTIVKDTPSHIYSVTLN